MIRSYGGANLRPGNKLFPACRPFRAFGGGRCAFFFLPLKTTAQTKGPDVGWAGGRARKRGTTEFSGIQPRTGLSPVLDRSIFPMVPDRTKKGPSSKVYGSNAEAGGIRLYLRGGNKSGGEFHFSEGGDGGTFGAVEGSGKRPVFHLAFFRGDVFDGMGNPPPKARPNPHTIEAGFRPRKERFFLPSHIIRIHEGPNGGGLLALFHKNSNPGPGAAGKAEYLGTGTRSNPGRFSGLPFDAGLMVPTAPAARGWARASRPKFRQ